MQEMIELVVTDLDGTLWGRDEVVHPDTLHALRELEERSVPVLVATGRSRRSAYTVLGIHRIALDAALHDGALGATTGGDLFHHQPFDPASLRQLLDVLSSVGLEPILEVDDPQVDFMAGDHPSLPRSPVRPFLTVDLTRELPLPVFRAIAAVSTGVIESLMSRVIDLGAAEAWATPGPSGEDSFLIARPASCSKWTATLSYCERVGIDPGRVLAIGDGNNDRELLTHARISVAVKDGAEALLGLADHVIDPPDQGGWAAVLELL
jgi:hydroxymethylpyrimidine pyrophosphatase-like HAD family hydrolase